MKKLFIFFALIVVLFYSNNYKTDFSLEDYFSGEYYCYTEQPVNNNSINLGFCHLTINQKSSKNNIVGESVTTKNIEINSALQTLKAKVIKTEYLSNGTTVIYAYTNLIKSSVELFNTKVNLQIALNNNTTTIGWPLILGSF